MRNTELTEIDFTNITYKLSRNTVSEKLLKSISRYGILSPPVLFKGNNHFTIVSGHNRLNMALHCGLKSCLCRILNNLNFYSFIQISLIKAFRSEIGPIGKIKLIDILTQMNCERSDEIGQIARQDLGIPDFILSDPAGMTRILSLPKNLRDYLDLRDPGYKTLRDLICLPDDSLETIDSWITKTQLRVNVFRDIVDYLYDIYRRDGTTLSPGKIDLLEIEDHRAREQYLHSRLRELRFPEYYRMVEKADVLIGCFRNKGISITIPPHFEGDSIRISMELTKKDGIALLQKKIEELDYQGLRRLLELL